MKVYLHIHFISKYHKHKSHMYGHVSDLPEEVCSTEARCTMGFSNRTKLCKNNVPFTLW